MSRKYTPANYYRENADRYMSPLTDGVDGDLITRLRIIADELAGVPDASALEALQAELEDARADASDDQQGEIADLLDEIAQLKGKSAPALATKMRSGDGGPIAEIFNAIADRLEALAQRIADRIRGQQQAPPPSEDPTAGMYNGRWYPSREAADAAEGNYPSERPPQPAELVRVEEPSTELVSSDVARGLEVLRARAEEYSAEWDQVLGEANRVNEIVKAIASALDEATANVERENQDEDVAVLTQRLEKYTEQWQALVDRAREVRKVQASIQEAIDKLEAQVDGAEKADRLLLEQIERKGDLAEDDEPKSARGAHNLYL